MFCETAFAERRRQTDAMVDRFRAATGASVSPDYAGGGVVIGDASLSTAMMGGSSNEKKLYSHYQGWTYSAIRPIASTIAGLPTRVARERMAGSGRGRGRRRVKKDALPLWLRSRSENLELYEQHEVLDLLDNPNPLMVRWHVLFITVAQLELVGKQHWWVTQIKGRRVLWPLPAAWVTPKHTKREAYVAWEVRPGGTGEPITVPREEMMYFYYPSPADPLDAYSPLEAMGTAVSADEHIQKAQAAAFRNGVWPKIGIIAGDIADEDAGDMGRPLLEHEQREALNSLIKRHYAGVMHFDEPLILDRLIRDVKVLSHNNREMDFTNSSKVVKARIMQGHGTNPMIAGEIEGANRASSAVARRHFADHTVNPKVDLLSQTLTISMAPLFAKPNERLHVWLEPYQPDDREERRKDVELAAKYGAVTRNEIREHLLGLDSWQEAGDDVLLSPATVVVPAKSRIGVHDKALSFNRADQVDVWLRRADTAEAALAGSIEAFLAAQRDDVIRQLRDVDSGAPELIDLVFDAQQWHERFMDTLRPVIMGLMLEGAQMGLAAVKSVAGHSGLAQPLRRAPADFEDLLIELPPPVAAGVRAEFETIMSRPYWPEIQQETRRRLTNTLAEAVANGESLYDMTVRIGDGPTVPVGVGQDGVLGSASNTTRATLIARTETTGALNAGGQAAMDGLAQDGLIDGKEWVATQDQYTRPTHLGMDGAVVPVRGMFELAGHHVPYPGHHSLPPEERCNCRCTTVAVHADIQEASVGSGVVGCLVHNRG